MSIANRDSDLPVEIVAVTGAAGFIGSAVMRACPKRGLEAVALVRACEVERLPAGTRFRVVDWADPGGISDVLAEVTPALVVHCAGATARGGETSETLRHANVALVRGLLESVSNSSPRAGVVVLSSAAVYGPGAPIPTSEEVPPAPVGDYATSKVEAESVARSFAAAFGLRVSIARPFNVLGVGEPAGSVVDVIASQILATPSGARATVRLRECRSIRDYVDVDDVADALLTLAERGEAGVAYNVCTGLGVSVAELVNLAARAWGRQVDIVVTRPEAPVTVSIGAPNRIAALGWAPTKTLAVTLANICEHFGP